MNKNYQQILYNLSLKAFKKNEIPVAAIIVKNGKIISKAYNKKNKTFNPLDHAEIRAIIKASKKLKTWILDGCDMYVSLEPCDMCSEVIKESRINNVFFLCSKTKVVNKKTKFIKSEECDYFNYYELLTSFFKKLRL